MNRSMVYKLVASRLTKKRLILSTLNMDVREIGKMLMGLSSETRRGMTQNVLRSMTKSQML